MVSDQFDSVAFVHLVEAVPDLERAEPNVNNSKAVSTWLMMLGVALLLGCRGSVPVYDQLPSFIRRDQLDSTIWFGSQAEGQFSSASAVILDENHLLTSAHVWAEEEEGESWWEADMSSRRRCASFDRRFERPDLQEVSGSLTTGRVVLAPFDLVAFGEMDLKGADGDVSLAKRDRADWALIRTEQPSWDTKDAAVLHVRARDPQWTVPPGTELMVAGFSSIFDKNRSGAKNLGDIEGFLRKGPYTLRGEAVLVDDRSAIRYSAEWPRPGGHSGGGVYLWNVEEERPELIGVFHSWSPSAVVRTYAPLGLSSLAFDVRSEGAANLFYTPIAEVLPAFEGSRRVLPR